MPYCIKRNWIITPQMISTMYKATGFSGVYIDCRINTGAVKDEIAIKAISKEKKSSNTQIIPASVARGMEIQSLLVPKAVGRAYSA